MLTVRDIIRGAAVRLGVIGSEEELSANEYADALHLFNGVVDYLETSKLLSDRKEVAILPLFTSQSGQIIDPSIIVPRDSNSGLVNSARHSVHLNALLPYSNVSVLFGCTSPNSTIDITVDTACNGIIPIKHWWGLEFNTIDKIGFLHVELPTLKEETIWLMRDEFEINYAERESELFETKIFNRKPSRFKVKNILDDKIIEFDDLLQGVFIKQDLDTIDSNTLDSILTPIYNSVGVWWLMVEGNYKKDRAFFLTDIVSWGTGWQRILEMYLAAEMAQSFGIALPQWELMEIERGLEQIRQRNTKIKEMEIPSSLRSLRRH